MTLKYKEVDEHLLRRLGQALVLQWDELPDGMQDVLIDQAVAVQDREEEKPHSGSDIETFIRKVKSISLPSTPPAPSTPQ